MIERFILGFICMFSLVPSLSFGEEAGGEKQGSHRSETLEKVGKRLKQIRGRLAVSQEKEQVLVTILDEVGQELSDREEDLQNVTVQIKKRKLRIDDTKEQIQKAKNRIQQNKEYLGDRLQALYMHGEVKFLEIFFSSSSYNELIQRTRFHSVLARKDAQRLGKLRKDLRDIEQRKHDMAQDLTLLQELEASFLESREAHRVQRNFRKELLAAVREEVSMLSVAVMRLERGETRLRSYMTESLGGPGGSSFDVVPFGQQKGRLVSPAKGRVSRKYGEYRHPKTGARLYYQGIDIRISLGHKVRAVAEGRVVKSSNWFKGYGKLLLVDHGSGFHTLYAHNSKLLKKEGDPVHEGETISLSGDSGSLDGAKLFFSIFENGRSVDPGKWILPR